MDVNVFKEATADMGVSGKIVTVDEGRRPVYLASFDTDDPYIQALAEVIFWSDQVREHAHFMAMLLPIEGLSFEHERAVMFKGAYEVLFERALTTDLNEDDITSLSYDFMGQSDGIVKFKRQLQEEQTSGKIRSLMWPTFLDHIAREAERYSDRQRMFMQGQSIPADRDEVINFWAPTMAEHSEFIAHFLDPVERDLISKALETNDTFRRIQDEHPLMGNEDPVTADVNNVIDFNTAALKGVEAGQIKSIITPMLADHVRREAILFSDELKKADMASGIQPKAA